MINSESLSKDWIKSLSISLNGTDPILIEKAIRSFYLLEQLILNKIDLIFKGGTCLILILPEPKRLSIDIDIIIKDKPDDLENIFNRIIKTTDFLTFKEVSRETSSKIEKAHYKFYYKASEELKDMLIINPLYNKLNGLKKNNPEAFYYWFHTINLK